LSILLVVGISQNDKNLLLKILPKLLANILENNFLQYLPNLSPSGNRDYCVDMLKERWLLPVFAESYLLLRVNQAKDLIAVRV